MMGSKSGSESLRFTRAQIFLSQEEAYEVAMDFWGSQPGMTPAAMTERDRAFVQGCLLIAVDKSEKAGFFFDVFASFMSAAPSRSVQSLVKSLAGRTARRWFSDIIDSDPKVSPVGKSAVLGGRSMYTADWRVRWGVPDPTILTAFLIDPVD
jgi:hypothetical protein